MKFQEIANKLDVDLSKYLGSGAPYKVWPGVLRLEDARGTVHAYREVADFGLDLQKLARDVFPPGTKLSASSVRLLKLEVAAHAGDELVGKLTLLYDLETIRLSRGAASG